MSPPRAICHASMASLRRPIGKSGRCSRCVSRKFYENSNTFTADHCSGPALAVQTHQSLGRTQTHVGSARVAAGNARRDHRDLHGVWVLSALPARRAGSVISGNLGTGFGGNKACPTMNCRNNHFSRLARIPMKHSGGLRPRIDTQPRAQS